METKNYDRDESNNFIQEEKFSSFSEMLNLGWSMNHYRGYDTLVGADLDKVVDGGIENDSLSGAQLLDQNTQN